MEAFHYTQRCLHGRWLRLSGFVATIFVGVALTGFRSVLKPALGQTSSPVICPTFRATQPIPDGREGLAAACINVAGQDFIYAVGGQDPLGKATGTVFYTKASLHHPVGDWEAKGEFTKNIVLYDSALVSTHGRLYILGGDGVGRSLDSVYYVQPQPGTGDTQWFATTSLTIPVYLHAAVPLANRIYVIGGYVHDPNSSTSHAIADVFSARILSDGTLSNWESESSLVSLAAGGISAHAAVASEEHQCIYVIGGWLGSYSSGSSHNRVFRACVEGSGKLGTWQSEVEALQLVPRGADGIYYHSAAIVDNRVFVIGGTAYNSRSPEPTDSLYVGHIDAVGHLGNWTVCAHCLPGNLDRQDIAVASSGTIYVIGGRDRSSEDVYDNVLFTPLLDFHKSAIPGGPVTYGDTITYNLRLANLGVRDFETLNITDTVMTNVPASLDFDLSSLESDPSKECQEYTDNTITCTVSDLVIGQTTDLSFAVTISQSTPALLSAPISSPVTSATPAPHVTWTKTYSAARLEVLGVGISGLLTGTLYIPSPETIIGDSIRVQAAFKVYSGGKIDEVTVCSGGVCDRLLEPTSTCKFITVYEHDVQASDAISVTFKSVGEVQPSALTAYFLRPTRGGHGLIGHTMNQALHRRDTYTDVLKLPISVDSGDVTVKAVVTDNDGLKQVISLTVQVGDMSQEITFTEPNSGNYLDIREFRLRGVPTTTNEVSVIAHSPAQNGESFGLVGLVADTAWSPLRVLNNAQACETLSAGSWCWCDTWFNTDVHVYLPSVLRNAP